MMEIRPIVDGNVVPRLRSRAASNAGTPAGRIEGARLTC